VKERTNSATACSLAWVVAPLIGSGTAVACILETTSIRGVLKATIQHINGASVARKRLAIGTSTYQDRQRQDISFNTGIRQMEP
jgi:hypothetical protein